MNKDDYYIEATHDQELATEGNFHYQQGLVFHQGKEQTKNYQKALKLFTHAACRGSVPAQQMLVCYFKEGLGTPPNLHEAYIWAVIAYACDHQPELDKEVQALEKQLSMREVVSAQEEANRRFQLLSQSGEIILPRSQTVSVKPRATQPGQPNLQAWNVSDLGKVIIHLNEKEKTIVVRNGRNSARFGLTQLFSPSCLRLLIDFDKHARDPHEPAIAYLGNSVNQALNLNRSNQNVVSDFNAKFRQIFGLAKTAKAFTWLPGTKLRKQDKSLKIHFQLKVNYRV